MNNSIFKTCFCIPLKHYYVIIMPLSMTKKESVFLRRMKGTLIDHAYPLKTPGAKKQTNLQARRAKGYTPSNKRPSRKQ